MARPKRAGKTDSAAVPESAGSQRSAAKPSEKPSEVRSMMLSVDKALRALAALSEAGPKGLPLNGLAKQLELNKSSLHVTLGALRFRDFVEQAPDTGLYRLGPAVLQLAQSYFDSLDVRAVLRPAIFRLASRINEVCHIAILDGEYIIYVEKVESQKPIQPGTRVGMRRPALTTAMGRAMIAFECPDFEYFRMRFKDTLMQRALSFPGFAEDEWSKICEAKSRGFGVDLEENVKGLDAVAVAVLRADQPVAACSAVSFAQPEVDVEERARIIHDELMSVITPPLHLPEIQ